MRKRRYDEETCDGITVMEFVANTSGLETYGKFLPEQFAKWVKKNIDDRRKTQSEWMELYRKFAKN